MGRGRGRPRKLVPPSPINRTSEQKQHEIDASNLLPTGRTTPVRDDSVNDDLTVPVPAPTAATIESPPREGTPQLWVEVLSGNRNPANGLAMEFVAPKRVNGAVEVKIEEADIMSEVKFWASSLIMYVLGGDLSMSAVKQFMIRNWNFVKLPDMFYNEEGYFILRFHSSSDKDAVMMQGPYTIRNMPMLLRDWKPDFNLKRDMLRTLPIWVKLPQLPLYLWGIKSLSKIGSAIGNPLVTDECTAHKLRVSYARLLIEVDVTQELPHDITIRDNEGNKMTQVVEYEWKPLFCEKCQKVGHICEQNPPKKAQKMWKPRPPATHVLASTSTPATVTEAGGKENEWTVVQGSGKLKGKGVQQGTLATDVNCSNGFDPLGTLNGPLVAQDTGQ